MVDWKKFGSDLAKVALIAAIPVLYGLQDGRYDLPDKDEDKDE